MMVTWNRFEPIKIPVVFENVEEIVKYPEPVLERPGEPVTEFNADLQKLVDDMFESRYAGKGIGLAAPQVGISKRLTVIDLSFKEKQEDRIVLVNPEIIFARASSMRKKAA